MNIKITKSIMKSKLKTTPTAVLIFNLGQQINQSDGSDCVTLDSFYMSLSTSVPDIKHKQNINLGFYSKIFML